MRGPVCIADGVIEVEADVDWTDGTTSTVIGHARAWTPEAALVEWSGRTWRIWQIWLPVGAVRPAGVEPLLDDLAPELVGRQGENELRRCGGLP